LNIFVRIMKNYLWNMFTNIKNGQMAKKNVIIGPRKNICESFLKILWNEGFISGYRISLNTKELEIFLKYTKNGKPVINSLKFLSKPSQRIYYSSKQIWKLDSSKTFIIFSTNLGLKSINDCKKNKIGGEPLIIVN
jgi:small subunit ribosomal protein S8